MSEELRETLEKMAAKIASLERKVGRMSLRESGISSSTGSDFPAPLTEDGKRVFSPNNHPLVLLASEITVVNQSMAAGQKAIVNVTGFGIPSGTKAVHIRADVKWAASSNSAYVSVQPYTSQCPWAAIVQQGQLNSSVWGKVHLLQDRFEVYNSNVGALSLLKVVVVGYEKG